MDGMRSVVTSFADKLQVASYLNILSCIWLVRSFLLSLPLNDRIYEETTMYYCVGIGNADSMQERTSI